MERNAAASILSLLLAPIALPCAAQEVGPPPLQPVPISRVQVDDAFWSPKLTLWREVTLADCFDKFEKGGTLENFDRVRDGKEGGHRGAPWFDGLLYEMIRASADFLAAGREPKLETRLDAYVDRIAAAAARDPEGYLNTYTQLEEPTRRWGANGGNDRWQHDLYNAGALVDAGVHYYRATGKTRLLEAGVRLANLMADVMGPPPRRNIIPGHALGEESLVKLALLFREQPELKTPLSVPVDGRRYLELAEFWIDARGHHEGREDFGAYDQDGAPVLQQETIEGHAVRAVLLCCGLVAAGEASGRGEYLTAADRLWTSMVTRRMYLTGGVGAESDDEKFGPDYSLPNTGYAETCASAAAVFFHQAMGLAFGEARYADELERALYNGVLGGVSASGNCYFYENPLTAGPERQRWSWHPCPCCPPMFLKAVSALPGMIYATGPEGIYVHLFIGSRADIEWKGTRVSLRQTGQYPWDGDVKLAIDPEAPADFALCLRVPLWCDAPRVLLNGEPLDHPGRWRGYIRIERRWSRGDEVKLQLPMPVQRVHAHPKVLANRGRVALQRGPIVYCLEGLDNGGAVRNLVLPPGAPLGAERREDLLGGVTVLRGQGLSLQRTDWGDRLYQAASSQPGSAPVDLTAIPFFARANREPTEMMVWVAETPLEARPLSPPTVASQAKPSASHCFGSDSIAALNDRVEPEASDDATIPRFTWWDHRGTAEWAQYDFEEAKRISTVEVYWWDERRIQRQCRVPKSWRLLYRDGDEWKPVPGASAYGTEMDRFNRVSFDAVSTTALRLEAQLQPEWSAGILEWRVE